LNLKKKKLVLKLKKLSTTATMKSLIRILTQETRCFHPQPYPSNPSAAKPMGTLIRAESMTLSSETSRSASKKMVKMIKLLIKN